MRAAIRGIDLILEQGMNVRVCTFPDGEDPDSFAKKHTKESLEAYLKENQQDFISFKAGLLKKEAASDPIKKAELIRNMVASIAKIPDAIKREVYIGECAAIMEISEQVLFSSLAQELSDSNSKNQKNKASSKAKMPLVDPDMAPMEVHLNIPEEEEKVNVLFELEKSIIGILLLYGQEEEVFSELVYKTDEDGELQMVSENHTAKVYEKIYLDLQDDEVEFANIQFQQVYTLLIEALNSENQFKIDVFLQKLAPELSSAITNILMQDEKYVLHDWERNEIYVKMKTSTVAQYVSDVILNLRRKLVDLKIENLMTTVQQKTPDSTINIPEVLQEVMEYQFLKRVISDKLNRVV